MPDRRPFLRRLGLLAFALVAVTAFCRSRGIDDDLPRVHAVTALVLPGLPVAQDTDGAHPPADPPSTDAALGLPTQDALFVLGLGLAAAALATTLARRWTTEGTHGLSTPPGAG